MGIVFHAEQSGECSYSVAKAMQDMILSVQSQASSRLSKLDGGGVRPDAFPFR